MPLAPGTKLGPYEIAAPIGAGGMGEVYRAHDPKLGRDVAIKVLPAALSHDPERIARFQREAKALAALNHPNIAAIYGFEKQAGSSFLVMELVPGETLAERIHRAGSLPAEEVVAIARQMADALEAAHEKGIVHRDLKPANVKVTPDDKVKILDFGLAKAYSGDSSETDLGNSPTLTAGATMGGVILGTAAYMAPEQARGKSVDRRADIWAFGVVLYEMLTGQQPFAGETTTDMLAQVITKDPDFSKIPSRFQQLLRWCLEKNPKDRLRSAADGITLLDAPQAVPPARQTAASAPIWLWAVAAIACIAAATLAVMRFREPAVAPPELLRFAVHLPENVNFSASGDARISPDGRHLAFSAVGPDGTPAVWVQDMDSAEARELSGATTGPDTPPFFWSPDSRYIAYSSAGTMLRKVEIETGSTFDICPKPGQPVVGGSWNRDGVLILGSTQTGLWRVAASGGTPVPLTTLDASRQEVSHELPQFLPDGKHFIYLRFAKSADNTGVYVGSLDDAPNRQSEKMIVATGLGASFVPDVRDGKGYLLFIRGTALVAQEFNPEKFTLSGEATQVADGVSTIYQTAHFTAARDELFYRTSAGGVSFQLAWYGSTGQKVGDVGDVGAINWANLSPDAKRVVYSATANLTGDSDIWVLDLARNASTRLTFGGYRNNFPIWTPDGRDVIFASLRQGTYDLYRKPADGSQNEELLLHDANSKEPWDVSPDGRYLLYGGAPISNQQLWILPLQGNDRKPILFSDAPANQADAAFSPDGRWVAYTSRESGQDEVYVRPFPLAAQSGSADGKWQISSGQGERPVWRSDGKEIVYLDPGTLEWMSISIDTSDSFQAGVPRVLFKSPNGRTGGYVASDLKRFLLPIASPEKGPQAFNVVVNWASPR
jgi:eukaryotic-like serine/threonine-protein kinase